MPLLPNKKNESTTAELEQELRQIYHDRNVRQFERPASPSTLRVRLRGEFVITLLVTIAVSMVVSAFVVIWWQPNNNNNNNIRVMEQEINRNFQSLDLTNSSVERLAAATVGIFIARPTLPSSTLLDQVYLANELVGQGLVLSSDGWIVTTQAVVANLHKQYLVSVSGRGLLTVDSVVLDSVLPLAYLKISADNLTPTPLAEFNELIVPQTLFVTPLTRGATLSAYTRNLTSTNASIFQSKSDLLASSEIIPDRYLIDTPLPEESIGAPIATAAGRVVGLVTKIDGHINGIVPLESVGIVFDTLFSNGTVRRASLGVNYTQSNWLAPLIVNSSRIFSGAKITSLGKRGAVLSNSSARVAGLIEGDIIVSIAGERVGVHSLSALLQQYRPGAQVELIISNGSVERSIIVTLGEVKK